MNKILLYISGYQNLSIYRDLKENNFEIDIMVSSANPEYGLMIDELSQIQNVNIVSSREEFLNTVNYLTSCFNYDYIFPTFPEPHLMVMSQINDRMKLLGISTNCAEKIKEKSIYYEIWKQLEIPVPQIYQMIPKLEECVNVSNNIKFPCLVKPSGGMSSVGIKIIENEAQLIEFFKDVDQKVHGFQESHGSKFKHFEYYSADTDYIIQEYIDAPVISIIGHVYQQTVQLDFIYDIESDAHPYRPETGLIFPSMAASAVVIATIEKDIKKFISFIGLDNSPFMVDVILKDGVVYFIDFAARISAGAHLIRYSGEQKYYSKLVSKITQGQKMVLSTPKSVIQRRIPLAPGNFKTISIKNASLADYIKYPSEKKIALSRNDLSIVVNGYFYVSGNSISEAEQVYQKIIDSIEIDYDVPINP